MKNFLLPVLILLIFSLFSFLQSNGVQALSITFPEYHVEIKVNKDSTMEVTETMVQKFTGTGHGVRRDVTLTDPELNELCDENSELTCGGFDELIVIGAYDSKGNELTKSDGFQTYTLDDGAGGKALRFEWEIWPNGQYLDGELVQWSVKYKILGGIQWRNSGAILDDNSVDTEVPYLYWNAFPENKSGIVNEASVKIILPEDLEADPDRLITYTDFASSYTAKDNQILLTLNSFLPAYSLYTVAYEFGEDDLQKPAQIEYKITPFMLDADLYMDGILVKTGTNNIVRGVPEGERELLFKARGFEDKLLTLDVEGGEEKAIEVEMVRTPFMTILYYLNIVTFVIFCCVFPFIVLLPVFRYLRKGRDIDVPKTIIPEFKPPKGVHPYLLGSIKDEKVDRRDIVGTIIDLAYRGHIKIIEEKKGKEYKLINLKSQDQLNEVEREIIAAIFGSSDETTTKKMRSTFPHKYSQIVKKIYDEMVSSGYFKNNPQSVRSGYLALGIFLMIAGGVSFVMISLWLSQFLNMVVVFVFGLSIAFAGLVMIPVSLYMPSKTAIGSKVYAKILGFRMYLHTAERFRLQKLGPDEFERFLSFAIVFGIEKEWAKKFEGIYEGSPDWYQSSTGNMFDAVVFSSMVSDFSKVATTSTTPISTSTSSSGGGWSGGGSFGGFSGGGGGGGSAGGW